MDLLGPPRVGVMVCHCGVNIAGVLDVEQLAADAAGLPDVVVTSTDLFACSSTGQDELMETIREHRLNRIVVAACTPRTHEPVFRETLSRIGFNPFLLEMVNIRDQCSWVHTATPELANEKAKALIRMGVARARNLEPLHKGSVPMTRAALVVGGGIAGIVCALELLEGGQSVVLVDRDAKQMTLPHSELLRREVYTKAAKGETMVRKFVTWKTKLVSGPLRQPISKSLWTPYWAYHNYHY